MSFNNRLKDIITATVRVGIAAQLVYAQDSPTASGKRYDVAAIV